MNCPKCSSDKNVKSGIIKERQRYKCKECGCNYTVELKSAAKPKSMKRQALHLYLEGLGFRSIGQFLGVSNVSVLNWIRSFGQEVQELSSQSQEIEMVEADEMHSWIWIAVDRYGKRFINFFVGDRSNEAAKEFWETLKQHQMGRVTSDFWKACESIIPKEKHIQIKAGTFRVEGYDSLFRHFLERMR